MEAPTPTLEAVPDPPSENSIMGRLLAKRAAAVQQAQTLDLPIPGYGGELVARYRILDPLVEGKTIGERIRKQFKDSVDEAQYYAEADTIIEACVGLYLANDNGELEAVDPDGTGEPVTYDHRLAKGLGIDAGDPPSARNVLLGLFGGNRVAVRAHADRLNTWMADPAGDSLGGR